MSGVVCRAKTNMTPSKFGGRDLRAAAMMETDGKKAPRSTPVRLRCRRSATVSRTTPEPNTWEPEGVEVFFDLHSQDSAHEYSALILFALIFKIFI